MTRPKRNASIGVCAALLALAAATGAQAPPWKHYNYPADGFAVSFTTLPLVQKKMVPTDAGPIELKTYAEQLGAVQLMVTVSNYGSALAGKDTDAQLQGAKNAAVKNAGAHLISEKTIALDDSHGLAISGLEFEAESSAAHFTVRIYIVGSALYQTLVAAPVAKPYAGTKEFLDSFQLLVKPGS